MTNGANKAQGGVLDLGQCVEAVGPRRVPQTGLTIEETTAGLTAFAKAGLIGSDAGTSFKTMLQRLSAPSGQAQDLMQKLGISAYDAQGNFVGLANVAGQLQNELQRPHPGAAECGAGDDLRLGRCPRRERPVRRRASRASRTGVDAVGEQGAASKSGCDADGQPEG